MGKRAEVFLTDDSCMKGPRDPARFSVDDLRLLAQVRGEILTPREAIDRFGARRERAAAKRAVAQAELLHVASRKARSRFARFQEQVADALTPGRAGFVRHLRVESRCTWRRVAELCAAAWGSGGWEPDSNQLAGMAICELAAELCGEHYRRAPWN